MSETSPRGLEVADYQVADEEIDKRNRLMAEQSSVSNPEHYLQNEKDADVIDLLKSELAAVSVEMSSQTVSDEVRDEANELNQAINRGELKPEEIEPEKSEAIRQMSELKEKNTREAIEEHSSLQLLVDQKKTQLRVLSRMIRELKRPPELNEIILANRKRSEIKAYQQTQAELEHKNPEAFYALNLKKLKGYSEQVRSGQRIIETEYVTENLDDVIDDLGKGNITFLYGETGSGKTELANLAALRFSGQKAELVRGYSGMGSEEMFGHLGLTADNAERAKDIPDKIDSEFSAWLDEHPEATDELQQQAKTQITQKLCQESGVTVSDFIVGAVYRAARDGKVVILDEANYIPPGLLAKLNDIMTKVPGEPITVQEDGVGPIIVKEGFGMMMTGNMNTTSAKRYKERIDPDLALRDRITPREYDYLPQAVVGSAEQAEDPKQKQIYEIVIGSLLTDQGGLNIPKGSLEKLWNFSQYAKMTQLAFAGRINEGDPNSFQLNNGIGAALQTDILISPRGIQKIIGEWSRDQYSSELDHYIYKHLIAGATNQTQKAYLYQLGQKFGFFGEGWTQPEAEIYSTDLKHFDIDDPRNKDADTEFVAPTKVVETVYGKPPARTEWPEGTDTEQLDEQEQSAELDKLQEKFEDLSRQTEEWREKIGTVCPVPSGEGEPVAETNPAEEEHGDTSTE